ITITISAPITRLRAIALGGPPGTSGAASSGRAPGSTTDECGRRSIRSPSARSVGSPHLDDAAQGDRAMQGLMQDYPLTIPHLFRRAETLFSDKGIVTAQPSGREHITYGDWAERTRRLGGVLDQLGISADGRVATFSWNTARHLELYFAAPCTGRVLHTLNLRLFPEQITYIVNHAEDEVIFVDKTVAGLLWPLLSGFETVRHIVVIDDGGPFDTSEVPAGLELHDYETLL